MSIMPAGAPTGRRVISGLAAALALAVALATGPGQPRAQEASHLLATAGTGGTYFPVGVAIATLTQVRLAPQHGLALSAITSAGSGENIKLLSENQTQFAIVQGLWGAYAASGTGPLTETGPAEGLRAITVLWPNVEHFALRRDRVVTGTIQDLLDAEGASFAIGARNSGTEGSNRHLLAGLGITAPEEHFDIAFLGYSPSADAFQNGALDALNPAAGPPVGAMTRLKAAVGPEVRLLNWTDAQIRAANGRFDGLWTPFEIPAGTYPGQDQAVRTIAQPNFLAVRADIPEEQVYLITKALYENLPFLHNIHPATRAMSLDTALAGLPLRLHAGAARYYREAGLTIPDRLAP